MTPSQRSGPDTSVEPFAPASSGHSAAVCSAPQALASELPAQEALLGEVQQNLQEAKQCASSLASRFQEHCPDLERQEAEVHKLGQRFDNLRQQVENR